MMGRLSHAVSCCTGFVLVASSGCSLYFGDDSEHGTPGIAPDSAPPPPPDAASAALAVDEPGIYEMAADATHLYWVDDGQFDGEANVRRMPLDGGPIETLFSAGRSIYSLAVGDGAVFVARTDLDYDGVIYRLPVAGGAPTVLATGFNPTSVTVDAGWVYYSAAVSPGGRILRVPVTGGTPEVIVDDVDNPWDLVASGGTLFYSEMNRGQVMRVDPGGTPVVLASGWVGTGWLTVDAEFVYFSACDVSECPDPHLYRVPRAGGTPELLLTGGSLELKLAVADDHLQWGSRVIPSAGGDDVIMPGDGYPIAVAATADAFYFADFFTGAIYRSTL